MRNNTFIFLSIIKYCCDKNVSALIDNKSELTDMKLCYIADAESIHTQRWVNYFAHRGHEVHLISFKLWEGYPKSVRFHKLTLLTRLWTVSRYINWLLWFIQIRRFVHRIKPDVIDAHYITAYGYLAIASGFHPVIINVWGSDILISPKQKRLYRFLTKYALKKTDVVICDSALMQSELLQLGANPSKIRIIYNGIDTQKFGPHCGQRFKDGPGIPEGAMVISTRNLRPVYNVEMLIRAVPLVLEREPQTRFMIIGEGEQRKALENLAVSLGISANVSFIGWIHHNMLSDYLASSDVYVSTSVSDSTSLSLQEAMACEVAPVVTDLPANREWITEGENGFLVPVGDVPVLADRIVYLLRNKKLRERIGQANRKIIMVRAEYEEEMSRVEKIYQEQGEGKKR